jgi:hypothetical protein
MLFPLNKRNVSKLNKLFHILPLIVIGCSFILLPKVIFKVQKHNTFIRIEKRFIIIENKFKGAISCLETQWVY